MTHKDITEGINSIALRSVRKSISNNSVESFLVLSRFVRKILYLSLGQKDDTDFKKYITFPSFYYSISHSIAKKDVVYQEINKTCTKEASITLKELIQLSNAINNKNDNARLEQIDNYYYLTYIGLSQLLYYIVNNADAEKFNICINDFNPLISSYDSVDFNYRLELAQIEINGNDESKKQIKKIKEEYFTKNKRSIYPRHAFTGIKYWVYYLYSEKAIDEQIANNFISKLVITNLGSESLLTDILFFQQSDHYYFNWSEWDYIERPDGEVYSPPVPQDWLTLGFMADLIRNNYFSINIDYLSDEDLRSTQYLVESLKQYGEYFKINYEAWKLILKTNSVHELSERINNILSQLIRLKRTVIAIEERVIAESPISQERVKDFKFKLGKKWREKARVHNLFEILGSVHIVDSEIKGLHHNIFCQNTKSMFVEGVEPDLIYGIYDFGAEMAKYEDNTFFHLFIDNNDDIVPIENLIIFLDEGLKKLRGNNYSPSLIFISNEYSYKNSVLLSNPKYKIKTSGDSWFSIPQVFGYYDSVPLYATHNNLISDRIIISDFKNSFTMRLKNNDDWFENILSINVRELDDIEASRRLKSDPDRWKNADDGIILNDSDALTIIKNSLIIELKIEVDFEISNKESYITGFIKSIQ